MTDAEIIEEVLGGRHDAYRGIVDRYYGDCVAFANRMLGNRQDAEDALQETFLRAYRALGSYRHSDRFRPWLFRILVNQCRTLARHRRRYNASFDPVSDTDFNHQGGRVDPTDQETEARDLLGKLLERLEPSLREAFLLKHGEGLEYSEMAEVTGASISALKMRVKRACDAMRPYLEDLHERV